MTIGKVIDFLKICSPDSYIEISYDDEWSILSIPTAGQFKESLINLDDANSEYVIYDYDQQPWYAYSISDHKNLITLCFKRVDVNFFSQEFDELIK